MNNDLISRSALLADAEKCGVMLSSSMHPSDEETGASKVIYAIVTAPAVDAVEVGNCKGCIWENRKRPQKCSCCRRNLDMKDCYEERRTE